MVPDAFIRAHLRRLLHAGPPCTANQIDAYRLDICSEMLRVVVARYVAALLEVLQLLWRHHTFQVLLA